MRLSERAYGMGAVSAPMRRVPVARWYASLGHEGRRLYVTKSVWR